MLFVAAAGNSALNIDTSPSYPASYAAPNVVAVAATDNDDLIASFSNYGTATVGLAAPGVNIRSTIPGNSYAYYNGTSMATPHVSGAAALVLSACTLNTAQLKDVLLNHGVEAVGGLASRVKTGGRLDVNAAIRYCATVVNQPPDQPVIASAVGGNAKVTLTWGAAARAASYKVFRGTVANVYGPTPVASGLTGLTFTDTAVTNGTTYHYAVVATNVIGDSPQSTDAAATPQGPPAAPAGVTATAGATGTRQITVAWSPAVGATSYTVRRRTSVNGTLTTVATNLTATSFVNTGLTRNTRYYYVVIAVNAAGSSPNSAQVNAVAR